MLVRLLQRFAPTRRLVFRLGEGRAEYFANRVKKFLSSNQTILDIGTGTGNITLKLQRDGYKVTPLDIADLSFTPEIKPVLYDGTTLPFAAKAFDVALILTVLHHTKDPAALIREAQRVARRVIIIEDVYTSRPQKYLTFFIDSLLNLEFFGHPHTNQTDEQWQATFKKLGLRLDASEPLRSFVVMHHRLYVLTS